MHTLLLSLANIHARVRMKATSHAFALAAYLPIQSFSKSLQLSIQFYVLVYTTLQSPSSCKFWKKQTMMVKSWLIWTEIFKLSICHLLLGLLIILNSSWSLAYHQRTLLYSTTTVQEFGNPEPSSPCLQQHTLDAIQEACRASNPCNIAALHKVCLSLHLNSTVQPFYGNWDNACPSSFFMPDTLHQWHKFCFDHCVNWMVNMMGTAELDWHFAILQPQTGMWHWPNGICYVFFPLAPWSPSCCSFSPWACYVWPG